MLCRNPYSNRKGELYPCGQCMPCRINRGRQWTHRLMLEANLHGQNCFLTLTYDDDHLSFVPNPDPETKKEVPFLSTLKPDDLKDFLKRLRTKLEPHRIRFYAVGEYGDETFRPHYHAALFNYPNCAHGNSRYSSRRKNCCPYCDLLRDTWTKGHIFVGDLSVASAQYISSYVTKKLTKADDSRLAGRYPEFARMSLKPGIGSDFMHEVASTLLQYDLHKSGADAPSSLRHGSRELPLGRYLRRRLRELIGHDKATPQAEIDKIQETLRPLRETAFENSRSFKQEVINSSNQKVLNAATKRKIFKTGKKL